MVGLLLSELRTSGDDYLLCVTGDHTTPTLYGDHTYQPVPIALAFLSNLTHTQNSLYADTVLTFDEIACAQGVLGRFSGSQIMQLLIKYSGL